MTKNESAQPQLPPLQVDLETLRRWADGVGYGDSRPTRLVAQDLLAYVAENESLKAAKPLRMFVWDGRGAYKISVCAPSVAEARTLALDEIAAYGMSEIEGSPAFRTKTQVGHEQPLIYLRPNAELVLSENGETEELNICLESECSKRKTAESRLAAMNAERDKALAENQRLRAKIAASSPETGQGFDDVKV